MTISIESKSGLKVKLMRVHIVKVRAAPSSVDRIVMKRTKRRMTTRQLKGRRMRWMKHLFRHRQDRGRSRVKKVSWIVAIGLYANNTGHS